MAKTEVIKLSQLLPKEVPLELRVDFYFDLERHPFAHRGIFERKGVNSVVAALSEIHDYAEAWLRENIVGEKRSTDVAGAQTYGKFEVIQDEGSIFQPTFVRGVEGEGGHRIYIGRRAKVLGGFIDLSAGDIFVGEGTEIVNPALIAGPTIIGGGNEIRPGALFRGDIIIGDGGVFRGELKNVIMMDGANFPHPSYVGDSICGYKTHFGNQATTANLGIYDAVSGPRNIQISLNGRTYDLGRRKIGIILGDYSQVGCNAVSDPASFLGPYTIVYQLTRINKGFYGPNEVLKNKPIERGVIERSPLRR
ncbi:MAG: hypothetical protein ACUVXI_01845 [bacterium]